MGRWNTMWRLSLMLAMTVGWGCSATDSVRVLRLAHGLDIAHPVHKAIVLMAEELERNSDGQMRLEIYPAGQLGGERELIELLQIGSLAMTKVSASPLEGFVPVMTVFNLPYVFRDRTHYHAVLDGPIGRQLLLTPTPVRLRGLGYYDAGARSFYTVERPVYTPEDLAGLKIRVQESQTSLAMVRSMGGAPTPIAWGELYTALQQGVVDGAENNLPSFYLSGHYEVCRYLTLDEHSAVPDILLISEPVWTSLTAEEQRWLEQAVDASVVFQRQLWASESEAALAAVAGAGVAIIRPDKALFRARVSALLGAYQGTPVGALLAAIAAYPSDVSTHTSTSTEGLSGDDHELPR